MALLSSFYAPQQLVVANMRSSCAVLLCAVSAHVFAVAPQAVDDARSIPLNSSITLNLIANDFDADGDRISVASITQPPNGTAVLNADGSVFYTPARDFSGVDSFS